MNSIHPTKGRIHYGWIIASVGMLCSAAALGFGRFTLGMLLPSMGAELGLTYSQQGFIGTANFLGYLVSALLLVRLSVKTGPRIFIFCALIAAGIFMVLAAGAKGLTTLLLLNVMIGICCAGTNIPTMGLVSAWFSRHLRGRAAGLILIGNGFAIMISGVMIPFINKTAGMQGWRTSWQILGVATVVIACIAFAVLRNRPDEFGLAPAGGEDPLPAAPISDSPGATGKSIYLSGIIYYLGAIYFLFGISYPIYTTFIVTALIKEWGFPENTAGVFWMWIGFLSMFSGPIFGSLSDRFGRRAGLIVVFSLQTASYLLIATRLPGAFLYISILFFGITAWSIPSIMAAAMGDYVGAKRAVEALGLVTFLLGLGQMASPSIAGALAQQTGSFSVSFYLAAAFSGLAIILSAFLKAPTGRAS